MWIEPEIHICAFSRKNDVIQFKIIHVVLKMCKMNMKNFWLKCFLWLPKFDALHFSEYLLSIER